MDCEVCGNELQRGVLVCPFCGAKSENGDGQGRDERPVHRVINLEIGMPPVETAITKLEQELKVASHDKVAVVTIIHGYGSSGRGGKIRKECRRTLDYLLGKRQLKSVIPGESFNRKHGPTRSLLRRVPGLLKSENLNRGNRGITIVEL